MVSIHLRDLQEKDPLEISEAFHAQGWKKSSSQFEAYLPEISSGERDVVLAENEGEFCGFLTIKWESPYAHFRERGIPEIKNFNVLKKYQRQGIGSLLMDEAERRIQAVSSFAGIGFGITPDYGPAQILYVKRGYIPDGKGLTKDGYSLNYLDEVVIHDDLVLYLIKELLSEVT
ncbi:MAG: GNAT family N-acetyltransferase [Bacteroidota bacterium]